MKPEDIFNSPNVKTTDISDTDVLKESCSVAVHPVGYKILRGQSGFTENSFADIQKNGKYAKISKASIYVSTLVPKDKMFVVYDQDYMSNIIVTQDLEKEKLEWAIQTVPYDPHLWKHEYKGTPTMILVESAKKLLNHDCRRTY